jgi:hypothetical protein
LTVSLFKTVSFVLFLGNEDSFCWETKGVKIMKKVLSLLLAVFLLLGMLPVAGSAMESAFLDVPNTHWAYHHVQQAAEKGWVTGIGGGRYAPEQRVTGAEFVTMITKSLYFEEVSPGNEGAPWYQPYVDVAQAHGLLTNDLGEKAVLDNPLNRYRMAAFLYNVVKEAGAVHYVDGGILSYDGVNVLSSSNASNYIGDWAKIPAEYRESVMGVYALKLLSGMDEYGTFGGESYLTRAQAAVVLNTANSCCSNSSVSEPDEKPTPHEHKWEKWPKGMTTDWSGDYSGSPPDENGYTNNMEIATDKNGKKIAIHMCSRCYAFFGGCDGEEWIGRFWDHIENIHDVGYCTYSVYAVFDVYSCEECGHFKRGDFSFYGYLDYSNGGAEWIYLTPEQIEELNLKNL